MKLDFSVNLDKEIGKSFEDYVLDVYYEHDTGYKEVKTDEIPSLEDIVYKKAFDSLVDEAKESIKVNMTESSENALSKFDLQVKEELDKSIESFTQKVMKDFVDRKVISVKKNGYSYDTEEITLTEYLENQIDDHMFNKKYNEKGETDSYRANYSGMDIISRKMISKLVGEKFDEVIAKQKRDLEYTLTKVVKDKLSEQCISDESIKRILQEASSEFEDKTKKKNPYGCPAPNDF